MKKKILTTFDHSNSRKFGTIYIQNTLNNTILTLTDQNGNAKAWTSSGSVGFTSSRKSTSYAAQAAAEAIAKKSLRLGLRFFEVKIRGLGYGKESALRGLQLGGLILTKIHDISPIAHNGCRAPKKRRK